MMKRFVLLLALFFSGFTTLYAQDDDPRGEKIQALKIAFITQKLGLTAEEAQKFWPIYNQYDQEVRSVDRKDVMKSDQQLLDIRKKYQPSFEKVLGTTKTKQTF